MQVCSNQTNHLGLVWKPFIKSATQNPQNSIILITHFAWWRFYTGWFLKYFTNRENKSFINEKLDELLLLVDVSILVMAGLCTSWLLPASAAQWYSHWFRWRDILCLQPWLVTTQWKAIRLLLPQRQFCIVIIRPTINCFHIHFSKIADPELPTVQCTPLPIFLVFNTGHLILGMARSWVIKALSMKRGMNFCYSYMWV